MKQKIDWSNHFVNFLSVILGVYLAFWVNEWAKNREKLDEKETYLKAMTEELESDITYFTTFLIPSNKQHLESVTVLISKLSDTEQEITPEELASIFNVDNFPGSSNTYESFKSSGKIALLTDLTLQNQMVSLYDVLMNEAKFKGDYQVNYFSEEILKWLTLNADFNTMELLESAPKTILLNKLIIYSSLIDQKISEYEKIVAQSEKLKSSIEAMYYE